MSYSEKKIKVAGNNVSYIDEGTSTAPPIILIHGFPLNKEMWNQQIEKLSVNYRVIAYDIRGHGNSDAGDDDFSIDLFADDLIDLMDALSIDETILCGLSMGGYIAIDAIVNNPERFIALVLCDTTCTEDNADAREMRMMAIESIKENGLEQYAEESLKKLFAPLSFSKNEEEIALVREMILGTSKESIYRTLHALSERKETCATLQEIEVPVLIVVGKEDEITPPAVAMSMHSKIEGSIMHIIDNAGHLSNMESSNEFNNQLDGFLSSVISEDNV